MVLPSEKVTRGRAGGVWIFLKPETPVRESNRDAIADEGNNNEKSVKRRLTMEGGEENVCKVNEAETAFGRSSGNCHY